MGGEGSGFEEYKPNPVITKMFKIVAHVINETIPAFEKEYATGLAKDEFFQKIVKFIAEEGVKLGKMLLRSRSLAQSSSASWDT